MFDIVSFCDSYNIPYAFKGKNIGRGWVGLNCPYHHDEDFHLGFNLDGAYCYCWKCGGHPLTKIIQEYLNCNFYEAEQIKKQFGTRPSIQALLNDKVHHPNDITLPGEELSKPYRKYLRRRGFDPDHIIEKYDVKAGGVVGPWKYRLMIPVYERKRLVTYQGRDITGLSDLRYKTLSVEKSLDDPKNFLYNIDNAKDTVIVCEGVTDVWRLGDGAVATLGTSTTEEQVRKLSRFDKVFILFDPEENAQRRAKKLGERIAAMGTDVEIIDTGFDHDPGDMTEDEVALLRKELGMVSGI